MLILTCALLALVPSGHGDWRWPLSPTPRVVRPYDPPPRPWLSGHRGVDLAARPGQPVYAAGAGRVGYAGRLAGQGVVTVLHGALRTTYLPVRPSVRAGQRVAAGARLGVVEDVRGHCGQVLCLHWGLRRGLTYLDPLSLLGRGPVRLLPVWGSAGGSGGESLALPGPALPDPALPDPALPDPGLPGPASARAARSPTASPTAPPASDVRGVPVGHSSPTVLVSATTAGGGAVAGAILASGLFLGRRRLPARRRLPPDVIDFTRERHRRQHPSA